MRRTDILERKEALETMAPTIPRVIIAFSLIVNTLFCLRKGLFNNLFKDITKEFK